ncbi:unnamed protein product [Peronospora belbahrii]|uniref:Uncharacterized protein n=1 Tax=Peronospora belbahrii TaxID=622444 RepID=A0AAU9KLP5_9STRA|nr:unnamed protein product [Peronospora belbahrii]CAH0517639.1 unnamed protein product [Peronospora belbahrii]
MLAAPIPIPWKDAKKPGLHGVIEIHETDFHNQKKRTSDLFVRDVVAIVNKKVQNYSLENGNVLREVTHLMLHGMPINNDYCFKSIIPDLAGSSPRLVAIAQTRWNGSQHAIAMTLFVATLNGKTITVNCLSSDTVDYLKRKIQDKEKIAPKAQRLMYAGKYLQDHHVLSDYYVQEGSTLHLSMTMRGGQVSHRPAFQTFADVSNRSLITAVEFSRDAPEWRIVSKGVNIEGRCKNSECHAFRHMVIIQKKFMPFNLMLDDDIQCPMCFSKVKPLTCGLYDCVWRFEGVVVSDNLSICSPWRDAKGYVYHRFDSTAKHGTVEWKSLLMMVKPRDAKNAKLLLATVSSPIESQDMCTICWSPFNLPTKCFTACCGHNFHRQCFNEWSKWCKANKTRPSCPVCRQTN